jgi:Tfp pilus assembly protein PilF
VSDLGVFKSSEFNQSRRLFGDDFDAVVGIFGHKFYQSDGEKLAESSAVAVEAFKKAFGLKQADNSIDKTLKERGERYGAFSSHAALSQAFKDVAKTGDSYELLSASQLEALEMIFHKIARILNGDPDYPDSWHDVAGYASLVEKELSE